MRGWTTFINIFHFWHLFMCFVFLINRDSWPFIHSKRKTKIKKRPHTYILTFFDIIQHKSLSYILKFYNVFTDGSRNVLSLKGTYNKREEQRKDNHCHWEVVSVRLLFPFTDTEYQSNSTVLIHNISDPPNLLCLSERVSRTPTIKLPIPPSVTN